MTVRTPRNYSYLRYLIYKLWYSTAFEQSTLVLLVILVLLVPLLVVVVVVVVMLLLLLPLLPVPVP